MPRKSPHEKGYNIPVKRRLEPGKYAIAYAKTLTPAQDGKIKVCMPSGKLSRWDEKVTIHEPQGFKPINKDG